MDLRARIDSAFPDSAPRPESSLVQFDGFDRPAKEYALRVFGGKTRAELAAIVGRGPTGG